MLRKYRVSANSLRTTPTRRFRGGGTPGVQRAEAAFGLDESQRPAQSQGGDRMLLTCVDATCRNAQTKCQKPQTCSAECFARLGVLRSGAVLTV